MGISKQTVNINKLVLGENASSKVIKYVPHGIDSKIFFPIDENFVDYSKYLDFKKSVFPNQDIEFVVFWNSRNIHRKRPADVILSYKIFCDYIGVEAAKKCALVMPHGCMFQYVFLHIRSICWEYDTYKDYL